MLYKQLFLFLNILKIDISTKDNFQKYSINFNFENYLIKSIQQKQ